MKYTSLFSAVAVAAAMGTSAFATVTTNAVGSVQTFDVTAGRAYQHQDLVGWTAQSDDQSEVIAAPLSENGTVEGSTYKHLKLNTEGQELVYTPTDNALSEAIIEMKVKLVGSDSEPANIGNDVHAAVFLKTESADPADDGLYAYTLNGWTQLETLEGLTNGSMVALRVHMDYGSKKASYEAALITDAEAYAYPNDGLVLENSGAELVYYPLGVDLDMANPTVYEGETPYLKNIAFKGTGGIDDLFVKKVTRTNSSANITLQGFNGEDWYEIETGTVDTEDSNQAFTSIVTMQEGKVATVTVCDVNGTTLATLNNVLAANGALTVSCADYAGFEPNEDYLIRVLFSDPVTTFTVSFSTEYGTAPQAQTVQSGAYATNPGAPVYEGADYTFVEWQYQGVLYDFANTPVTGDITLVAAWQAASSGGDLPESFSIGDASQALPAGVKPIEIADGKFIVNVVEPTGAIASLIGADSLGGTFSDVNATRTEKNGYTELSYTMGNETAKFFKVKFTK